MVLIVQLAFGPLLWGFEVAPIALQATLLFALAAQLWQPKNRGVFLGLTASLVGGIACHNPWSTTGSALLSGVAGFSTQLVTAHFRLDGTARKLAWGVYSGHMLLEAWLYSWSVFCLALLPTLIALWVNRPSTNIHVILDQYAKDVAAQVEAGTFDPREFKPRYEAFMVCPAVPAEFRQRDSQGFTSMSVLHPLLMVLQNGGSHAIGVTFQLYAEEVTKRDFPLSQVGLLARIGSARIRTTQQHTGLYSIHPISFSLSLVDFSAKEGSEELITRHMTGFKTLVTADIAWTRSEIRRVNQVQITLLNVLQNNTAEVGTNLLEMLYTEEAAAMHVDLGLAWECHMSSEIPPRIRNYLLDNFHRQRHTKGTALRQQVEQAELSRRRIVAALVTRAIANLPVRLEAQCHARTEHAALEQLRGRNAIAAANWPSNAELDAQRVWSRREREAGRAARRALKQADDAERARVKAAQDDAVRLRTHRWQKEARRREAAARDAATRRAVLVAVAEETPQQEHSETGSRPTPLALSKVRAELLHAADGSRAMVHTDDDGDRSVVSVATTNIVIPRATRHFVERVAERDVDVHKIKFSLKHGTIKRGHDSNTIVHLGPEGGVDVVTDLSGRHAITAWNS